MMASGPGSSGELSSVDQQTLDNSRKEEWNGDTQSHNSTSSPTDDTIVEGCVWVETPSKSDNCELQVTTIPGESTIQGYAVSLGQWITWITDLVFLWISWASYKLMKPPFTVGILTWDQKDDCEWLKHLLKSDPFTDVVNKVNHMTSDQEELTQEQLSSCSYFIFYHEGHFGPDLTESMMVRNLEEKYSKYVRHNTLIVLGNLEDKEQEEEMKRKLTQSIYDVKDFNTLFFTKREINFFNRNTHLSVNKLDQMKTILSRGNWRMPYSPGHTIGIFSRSSQVHYDWLENQLRSFNKEVQNFYISNNGRRQFFDKVSQCTFAILYHTKKRGRINITDVTDSLYDEELEHMAKVLGRDNVIVVVDDLDNSDFEEKQRILSIQPSIERWATDLILFTEQERDSNYRRPVTQQEMEDEKSLKEKQNFLKDLITEATKINGDTSSQSV